MRAMNDPIQDRLGQGGVAEHAVPVFRGELAGDDQRAMLHTLINDIQQGVAYCGLYRRQAKVIEDQQMSFTQGHPVLGQ